MSWKHGVSEFTLYNLKTKFCGMDVSDAMRLKALENANGELKRLLAHDTRLRHAYDVPDRETSSAGRFDLDGIVISRRSTFQQLARGLVYGDHEEGHGR